MILLVGIVLALWAPTHVSGQQGSCEAFAGDPAICRKWIPVGTSIYIPAGTSQYVLNVTVSTTLAMASPFATTCQEALAKFNCLGNFLTCTEPFGPGVVAIPVLVCESECQKFEADCYNSFFYAGALGNFPNCQNATVFPPGEYSPTPGLTYNCTQSAASVEIAASCPPHYAASPYADGPLACLPQCPTPYYDDDQWDALWYLYALFGILTIVVAIFVLPPYFFSPSKWTWPQQMNMWIMFCSTMLAVGNSAPLIFYGNNWRDVVCANDVAASEQTDNSLCTFQAVFQIYWGFAGILWWLFLVAKAALLVNGFRTHVYAEMICAHLYCWGVPLIQLTILLSNGKIGSGSPPICNYLVTGPGDDGWWIQSILLIPEAIVLLIGCGFIMALLYTLIKYEGVKGLRKKGRLLTYLICFLLPNLYLEIFYYVTKTHDSNEFGIMQWFKCLALLNPNDPTGDDKCDSLHAAPNYPGQVVNVLLVSSVSFSYMLIFGLKLSVFQWWWALIKGIFTCDWKNFGHWWTDISTSQTSRSTSAAS